MSYVFSITKFGKTLNSNICLEFSSFIKVQLRNRTIREYRSVCTVKFLPAFHSVKCVF